ncbi:MAG TPA: septal ring lytic transglycosylase RlpA family protein [Candidatus Angelobacter sp.]|jgi:rare lipoprotein A|nr:septal ring lytic transglycosylase RlpA family protein [Candidatus Angelobacter sp.]
MAGCGGHHRNTTASVPPPPEADSSVSTAPKPAVPTPAAEPEPGILIPPTAKVIYTETGWASWYGPSYHKRKAANGEVYDMNGMTAAHRTLPLNSIARVTNLKTGHSELLRITDRGPFVNNRIIDLSKLAAQKLDVFGPGTAKVKIEVLQSPAPIDQGGRWCVQIGAFKNSDEATALKDKLSRRYQTAKVLQFTSPIGEDWLRVRVRDDDKQRAQALMQETQTEAGMFLVRLD